MPLDLQRSCERENKKERRSMSMEEEHQESKVSRKRALITSVVCRLSGRFVWNETYLKPEGL